MKSIMTNNRHDIRVLLDTYTPHYSVDQAPRFTLFAFSTTTSQTRRLIHRIAVETCPALEWDNEYRQAFDDKSLSIRRLKDQIETIVRNKYLPAGSSNKAGGGGVGVRGPLQCCFTDVC
jgi:hypothetical protein